MVQRCEDASAGKMFDFLNTLSPYTQLLNFRTQNVKPESEKSAGNAQRERKKEREEINSNNKRQTRKKTEDEKKTKCCND